MWAVLGQPGCANNLSVFFLVSSSMPSPKQVERILGLKSGLRTEDRMGGKI